MVRRDVVSNGDRSDKDLSLIRNKEILRKTRCIELAEFTLMEPSAHGRLPWINAETLEPGKEIWLHGAAGEFTCSAKPAHSYQSRAVNGQIGAVAKIRDRCHESAA